MFFRVNDFWVFCWSNRLEGFYNFHAGFEWLMRSVNRSIKINVINLESNENENK